MTVSKAERGIFIDKSDQGGSFVSHLAAESKFYFACCQVKQVLLDRFLWEESDVQAHQILLDNHIVFILLLLIQGLQHQVCPLRQNLAVASK